ncbi:MAG: phospho-N-acetylmuramoyl-pentapeptide-transferase [Candidatus Nanopelagicales bacterium]
MRLIVFAAVLSLVTSLLTTTVLIKFLRNRGLAQAIKQSGDGAIYPDHEHKRGTPSMGGIAIVFSVVVGYSGSHLVFWTPPSASGLLVLGLTLALASIGFVDDYKKVFLQHSAGIKPRTKLIFQTLIGFAFAFTALQFADERGITPASLAISIVRETSIVLPAVLMMLFIWLMITATTNAVNITDGLDGLASGAAFVTFAAYALIGFWQFGQSCARDDYIKCYEVRDPLDLAIVAAAFAAAVFGFLWFNTSPAIIIMGDTGSFAIGGAIVSLAIFTNTQLLLIFLGGLFVMTTGSVVLQRISFKVRKKRIFLMSPIHHHFELKGWPEQQIVVRFWILQGLFVGTAMALFYAEWVAR